ncbi:M20 family metallo-hydrolase [Paeniglutamicibacter cryotolerans]|uniref:N-carbamoyl-L-amino-acid hydrolase n=1 Tax=Paeniglutamicibacter cryotolerans TaxID=670079 RepID=A0A839QD48_9MICC|nr:M20 family metallo-hydrolase [Paeniglutamicibacter cryotolerans]MBB2994078.1 N-carbamoyl-L-amino-acid hydrolase [Paeniglutamicibacter cryotolerans]
MFESTLVRTESDERLARSLTEISGYRDTGRDGWSREVFSDPYRVSRSMVARTMSGAGLEVHRDGAGNIIGRLPGSNPLAPPLVSGSHTDTVDGGGRFDGIVGVMGAIEAARSIRESGSRLTRDLLVVDFLGEESNEFGLSCLGSRSIAGQLDAADLARTNGAGDTLGGRYASFGLDPDEVIRSVWPSARRPHAFVELHIEQGPTLETNKLPLGIVTAITGIERMVATFAGAADHAGTTSMTDRVDAMVAAAEAVLAVRREACGAPNHAVATTTALESASHSTNVVPSRIRMLSEVRSVDGEWLRGVRGRLTREILLKARETGVEVDFDWSTDNDVIPAHRGIQDVMAQAIDASGLPWMALPSGATHDAAHLASIAPMGMLFVPSRGGKSHCPEEWSDLKDISTGVAALAQTLMKLDQLEPTR